jgi:hypothetical protein
MTIWHAVQSDDLEAQQLAAACRAMVQLAGGDLISSLGFGAVPPVLVLTLPDGVEPGAVLPGLAWREYKEPMTIEQM